MSKKLSTNEFILKSNKIHNNRYDYSLTNYIGTFVPISIICTLHGEFEQIPNNHLNGSGCPICGNINSKLKQQNNNFIENSKNKHGDKKYDYSLVKYINNRTNITLICNDCENTFGQTPINNLKYGCPYCSCRLFDIKKFILKSNEIHNNKYDYSLVKYKNSKIKVTIICPIHGKFKQRTSHHLTCGCPKCSNKHQYTTNEFIDKSNKIHNNKYDYSLVKYKNSKTKITIICPTHGKFNQTPSSHLNKRGCPKCNNSKGEDEIKRILNINKIFYEPQKTFNECKNKKLLPFDFYLSERNVCIEYDGEQHYKSIRYWGDDNFKKVKNRDKIKNNYCRNNNIQLIRIKYDENIEKRLLECGIITPEID